MWHSMLCLFKLCISMFLVFTKLNFIVLDLIPNREQGHSFVSGLGDMNEYTRAQRLYMYVLPLLFTS